MYQIAELQKFPSIFHAFSEKSDGNMSFLWGDYDEVQKNRLRFLSQCGIEMDDCVAMRIKDSDIFVNVKSSDKGKGMRNIETAVIADGIFTNEKGIFLFLVIADCLPIIIFDTKGNLALIHAGWKSTNECILEKAIKKFVLDFKADPNEIFVAIGPAIHKESFVFKDPIQKTLPSWHPFLSENGNSETSIDLIEYNRIQCMGSGVLPENIFIAPINTAKNDNFFSHFRDVKKEGEEGRFACIVGIK